MPIWFYTNDMSPSSSGVFATLPQNFFSPLASPNREHYAAFLVVFYRVFQESPHGVERNVLVSRYTEYIALHRGQFSVETEEEGFEESTESNSDLTDDLSESAIEPARYMASRFLRTLIRAGWVSEETLSDYTRVINMAPFARPFFEGLARVEEGLKTEYESHVVAVYSLLCADAAFENGHYAVLNAHASTIALIDSLKVLSQSIRNHYERLTEISRDSSIRELLHLHYDLYASDILDGAYKRLKTSDNLSRYRPRILKRVAELLNDRTWLDASAGKYSRLGHATVVEAREKLVTMLEEIRDTLKALDPLLEEIDRRNMLYARSSTERVKTLLEPDSTLAGRIALLVRGLFAVDGLHRNLAHHLYHVRHLAPGSLYRRWLRENLAPVWKGAAGTDTGDFERAEAELRLRLEKQLSPKKISLWLDESGGGESLLHSALLVRDADSFVRLLYAVIYADSRSGRFDYRIEEGPLGRVRASEYEIPDLVFRRKT